jgi:hypothetical protein
MERPKEFNQQLANWVNELSQTAYSSDAANSGRVPRWGRSGGGSLFLRFHDR